MRLQHILAYDRYTRLFFLFVIKAKMVSLCAIVLVILVVIIVYMFICRQTPVADKITFYGICKRFELGPGEHPNIDTSRILDVYVPKGMAVIFTNIPENKKYYANGYEPKNIDSLLLSGPGRHVLAFKRFKLIECLRLGSGTNTSQLRPTVKPADLSN